MRNVLVFSLLTSAFSVNAGQLPLTTAKDTPQLAEAYGQLPLSFEMNRGQTDEAVKFLSRGQGYTLFLTPTEAVLSLRKPEQKTDKPQRGGKPEPKQTTAKAAETLALQMQLLNANSNPAIKGLEELPGTINYLKGNDSSKWHQNIATYGKVHYQNVYPGIDLVYYGKQRQLEYDFIVQPGANPNDIRLNFKGVDTVKLADNGDLLLNAKSGEVRLEKPVLYQTINGERHEVAGDFVLQNPLLPAGKRRGEGKMEQSQQVGFQVAAYDAAQPLVIDPVLVYSTYLGGSGWDDGKSIAVDSAGNAYVTGQTRSLDFPTVNAKYPNPSSCDAFVTKFNATGSQLLYSTYLGGSNCEEGNGIAVDSTGNALVTGYTCSYDFPIVNAKYPNIKDCDAFVTKFNANGSQILYSTYLGGSYAQEMGEAIVIDSAGNAIVTGYTASSDFPTVNAKYPKYSGNYDVFVTKLNATGSQVLYSTYLGGSYGDVGNGIAVDSAGNAYVTGTTGSTDFPSVNAKYPNLRGGSDVFIAKFNATGNQVLYSTYLGGSYLDNGVGIAVDSDGNAYVTGNTYSTDFPAVNAKYSNINYIDAFVTKFNATGSQVLYSTYLGGSGIEWGNGIAVDSAGNAVVTGYTSSSDFPTVNAKYPKLRGRSDAFVTQFNATGGQVRYSTYLGGGGDEEGHGIAVDSVGNTYVTGKTWSSDFPSHANNAGIGSFDTSFDGVWDAFVAKIGAPLVAPLALDFGNLIVTTGGDSKSLNFNLRNAGNVTLSGTAAVTGPFTLVSGSSFSLPPGTSKALPLNFVPNGANVYQGSITLKGNFPSVTRPLLASSDLATKTQTTLNFVNAPQVYTTKQDFGPFGWFKSQIGFELAKVAAEEMLNESETACYRGTMSTIKLLQNQKMVEESLRSISASVFKASFAGLSTGSVIGDFILKFSVNSIATIIKDEPLGPEAAKFIAEKTASFVIGKAAKSYLVGEAVVFSANLVNKLLADDDISIWNLDGDNKKSRYYTGGYVPETSVKSVIYYNPYTYYTTIVANAECGSGSSKEKRLFTLSYKVNETSFHSAEKVGGIIKNSMGVVENP